LIGIDLSAGECVDEVVDVTDSESDFWKRNQKNSRMLIDLWRFTLEGVQTLFEGFEF
jgi:hypothetical protein